MDNQEKEEMRNFAKEMGAKFIAKESTDNKATVRRWAYQLLADLETFDNVEGERREVGAGNHIVIDLQFKS